MSYKEGMLDVMTEEDFVEKGTFNHFCEKWIESKRNEILLEQDGKPNASDILLIGDKVREIYRNSHQYKKDYLKWLHDHYMGWLIIQQLHFESKPTGFSPQGEQLLEKLKEVNQKIKVLG